MSKRLSVADVARLRRTGRVAAFRWLKRNAREYLHNDESGLSISERDLAKVWKDMLLDGISRRLAKLEEACGDHERRLDRHAAGLRRARLL